MAASSVIHVNTVIYQLVGQITTKLCIDLQDKSNRESTYAKLSCFGTVYL